MEIPLHHRKVRRCGLRPDLFEMCIRDRASEAAPLSGFGKVQYAWNMSLDFVRLVWISLGDLISGSVGVRDLSGPVGIVDTMTEVGSSATSAYAAFYSLTYFAALIAVNLAVMNLLPLPALDGGRVFFLLLNTCLLYTSKPG